MPFDPTKLLKEFDAGKLEALIDTMVLAADADGEFSEEERATLLKSIESLMASSGGAVAFSGTALADRMANAHGIIRNGARDELIAAVKERLSDTNSRTAALGLAISVTAADGIVRTSERELIFDLAEAFEVDRDVAADMVRDITRN